MLDRLLHSIEQSDSEAVSNLLRGDALETGKAWEIHLSLYPVAQRVQNPPYINPHWPKQYRISREFLPYLEPGDVPALVRLEANEYAKRQKLDQIPKPAERVSSVTFDVIEAAIKVGEPGRVAALFESFVKEHGGDEFARRLLLLGSGYLNNSLGHSVSCTAFILLEMLERSKAGEDPWPGLCTLAVYFCKGGFQTTPALPGADGEGGDHLLRAVGANGFLPLHHTITRYAIGRVKHLLSGEEHSHLLGRWLEFIGDGQAEPLSVRPSGKPADYDSFIKVFSQRDEGKTLAHVAGLISSGEGRKLLGRYLIKGVCDLYDGDYDPHFLTGLGSALGVVETWHEEPPLALNALRQYLNYYFSGL